ncbi:MAG TPA: hypothetical protein VLB68_20140 [Pyrinomonadaceae bacterium]|nr:hypothetical protein [Pyrinomonadaceae bacterium]
MTQGYVTHIEFVYAVEMIEQYSWRNAKEPTLAKQYGVLPRHHTREGMHPKMK